MNSSSGKMIAAMLVFCTAALGSAQTQPSTATAPQARPAVAFPPTPTPAPKAEPMTEHQLETHLVPSQFLARTSDVLTIVYNGFRRSQVDPCGCVTHKLGGLDKEARLVSKIEELKVPVIEVDAGGFIRDMPDKKMVEQAKYLLKGLGQIGYDAVNVGFTDLALTPDELKETAKAANINLVSANIQDETGALAFDPYLVKDVTLTNGETLKVGVLGVTRPRVELTGNGAGQPVPVTSGTTGGSSATVTISDPVAAINKYMPELAEKAEFVIVMDYDRRSKADQIVKGITDKANVDVLVLGENSQIQGSVQAVDGVQVVSGGYEGRQLGTLYVELKDKNVASTWNKHIEVLQTIPPVPEITKLIEEAHNATKPAAAPQAAPTPSTTKLNLGTN